MRVSLFYFFALSARAVQLVITSVPRGPILEQYLAYASVPMTIVGAFVIYGTAGA